MSPASCTTPINSPANARCASNEVIDERATRGERIADDVAAFGGSWTFIIWFMIVIMVYTAINVALGGKGWDPYPFILLILFLSLLAAIQAPVIMMSQNRQDKKTACAAKWILKSIDTLGAKSKASRRSLTPSPIASPTSKNPSAASSELQQGSPQSYARDRNFAYRPITVRSR